MYNLTPEGVSQKLRLTVAYVQRILNHYSQIRQTLRDQLQLFALHPESRVAICGTGDFAELVYLGLKENGIEEIEVFDWSPNGNGSFLGMRIRDLGTLDPNRYDCVLVSVLGRTNEITKSLKERGTPPERVVTFFANGASNGVN